MLPHGNTLSCNTAPSASLFIFFSETYKGIFVIMAYAKNNCSQVLHIARPNFYVKLELPPGKSCNIRCQHAHAIQNQDAAIRGAVTYVVSTWGRYS